MQNDETECENEASYYNWSYYFTFILRIVLIRIINQHQDTNDKQHV